MATLTTDGMPKEYTETLAKLAYNLEDRVYGDVKIMYQSNTDSFVGSISHRGVKFYFTIAEIGEQIINGVGANEMVVLLIADYRNFIPTRFIKKVQKENVK